MSITRTRKQVDNKRAHATSTTRTRKQKEAFIPWILLTPVLILILGFMAYPILSVVVKSFYHEHLSKPWENGFAGLENYRYMLFEDRYFWPSLGVSAKWVIVQVVFQLVLGLLLALIVNQKFRGRGTARALVFSPWAISGVLTTSIWLLMYNPASGIVTLLEPLGIHIRNFAPLASADTAFWAASLAELWRGIPFFAILLLAELQSIPRELYESASVDGANRWQKFRAITLPHLRNVIFLTTLLRAVWEFNNVDLLYTLTNGGPGVETLTLPLYVARKAVTAGDFGYGSALTIVAFFILLFFSIAYFYLNQHDRDKK